MEAANKKVIGQGLPSQGINDLADSFKLYRQEGFSKMNPYTKALMLSACVVLLAACKPSSDEPKAVAVTKPETTAPIIKPDPDPETTTAAAAQNSAVINFQGFGPAKFGADEESVRMAWGQPIEVQPPSDGSSCFYLYPEKMPNQSPEIAFMFEQGKFVRFDVENAKWISPGNLRVGDSASQVKAAFAGRLEEAPQKYIEGGQTLIVTPEDKSDARLVFETDATGKILTWRIGVPPQVFYVEGCS